jgi:hypothetical protein
MTDIKTAESTRGTHPPLGILMHEDETKIISIIPKNEKYKRATKRFLCHTKSMIIDVKHVVTNIPVMHAIPENEIAVLAFLKVVATSALNK